MTYGQWLTEWLGRKEDFVKEATAAGYAASIENHILPQLGGLTLEEITEDRLQKTALYWLGEGRCDGSGGLADRTVRGMVTLVKVSLRAAAKEGRMPPQHYDIYFPPMQKRPQMRVLSKEEQAILLQYIYLHLTPKNLGIFFCLHTGLRIGELCALQWKDVDMTLRTISVRHTVQRIYRRDDTGRGSTRVLMTSPKSGSSVRTVPVSTLLYPLLERMHPGDGEAYLLTGTRHHTEPRTYRDYFDRLLRKLGLPHIRFHGLRHTFATRLIENGADYKTVSELLGHASVNITLNLYVHPQMEQKRHAVELLNCL